MNAVFLGNGLFLLAAMLLYGIFAGVLSILCFVHSIRKEWDACSLTKTAMIVKLCHVPAYVLIFVLGVIFALSVFTFPFALLLIFLDCVTLFLTGILSAAAVINAVRHGMFQLRELIWLLLLQFVFCADVVATMILYRKLSNFSHLPCQTGADGK